MNRDEYTDKPTHLRIFTDGSGEWIVDGADDDGRYTPICWSYDAVEDAVEAAKTFPEYVARSGITFNWRGAPWR